MKRLGLFALVFALFVPEMNAQRARRAELIVLDDATHFFVLGDWGRNGYERQQEVADAMQAMAQRIEPEFIISTGDNFYPDGVASVDDPLFQSSYEAIYRGDKLFEPWYCVMGNHDYRGDLSAQIEYTQLSRRWNMPALYWSDQFILEDDETRLDLFFVDTSPLEDEYWTRAKYRDAVSQQDTTAQLAWLEQALATSSAEWRLVVGHHPVYTSGKRRDDPPYVRGHLESRFDASGVQAYFCGHEHDLQHQRPEHGMTHYFVSGAGSEVRPTGELEMTRFAQSIAGFMAVSLLPNTMLVQAISYQGEVLYQTAFDRTGAFVDLPTGAKDE